MNVFAALRAETDLERALPEIAALLSFRRRQGYTAGVEALLGIWIEPQLLGDLPVELELRGAHGNVEAIRIRETVGVVGIWALCWLEPPEHSAEPSRGALLEALVEERRRSALRAASGRFIPVFFGDVDPAAAKGEYASLQAYCGQRMGPPLFQDLENGRLSTRSGPG